MNRLSLMQRRVAKRLPSIITIALFAIVGVVALIVANAAGPLITFEAEDGALNACASPITDPEASAQKAVRFGSTTCTTDDTIGAKLPITYDLASIQGAKYFVATTGSDASGSGSLTAPFATLTKAYATAKAGDTIIVRGGTYRQGNITFTASKPVRVLAYTSEVPTFSGSQAAQENWSSDGALRWQSYSPQPVTDGSGISFTTGQNLSGDQVGKYPDQAWSSELQLRQVATKNAVEAGTFWVDNTNNRIYTSTADVQKGNIEFSQKDVFLTVQAPGTTIEGIRVTRFSNSANDYGVIKFADTADNSTLRNVEISDTAFIAISYLGGANINTRSALRNVTVASSNWMGVNATYTDDLTLEGFKATNMNQFNEFTHSPQSGGLKTSRTRNTKVIRSDISNNRSHGLWFDQSNVHVEVANTTIINNSGTGLFFEISDDLWLVNNYIRSTGGARAVKLAGSSGLKLVNNTIIGGADPLGIYVDNRSREGCADPSKPLCENSYGSDRDTVRPRPTTLDWIPRLDMLVNNIIAFPTNTGYCGTLTAVCITKTNASASVPISTVIHKADSARGLAQTIINGNVYTNGSGNIINTEIGNFKSISTFAGAMAGAPVGIGGFEQAGRFGNEWVTADGTPTDALRAAHPQAAAVPANTFLNQYIPAGTKRYGADLPK